MTGFIDPRGEPAVAYATNDLLPAASVNSIIDNEIVAFRRSLSHWLLFNPPPTTTGVTTARIPAFIEEASAIVCVAAASGAAPSLFALRKDGTAAAPLDWDNLADYSGIANGVQMVAAGMVSGDILLFDTASATDWHVGQTGGTTLSNHTFADAATFTAGGPILAMTDSSSNPIWLVPGRRSTDDPTIAYVSSGGASCSLIANAGAGQFVRRIATDGAGNVCAVGGSDTGRFAAVSTNYGVTWTWPAYPTLADDSTTAEPSVAWDSVRSLFVTTMLDDDGKIVYCSSPDGSSWGAWHRIASAVGGTVTATTIESADIVIIGGTWIICRPFDPLLTGTVTMQVWASHDGGATWFDITPPMGINATDGAWMVQLGNRVGISTNKWFALSAEFDVATGTASEVV